MAGRFNIALLGDKELSAALAALTDKAERKVLIPAFRKASQTVLADAQRRVGAGVSSPLQVRGRQQGQALTGRQVRRLRRQGAIVRGIRNSLAIRPLRRSKNRVGYTVVTGTREQMGITGKYYSPAHVELGHAAPGAGRAALRARRREFGGRRTPPHPYLRPALKSNEGRLLAQLSQDIGAGIERVAQEK